MDLTIAPTELLHVASPLLPGLNSAAQTFVFLDDLNKVVMRPST